MTDKVPDRHRSQPDPDPDPVARSNSRATNEPAPEAAIVLAAHGTALEPGRAVLDAVAAAARLRYPGREVLQAVTSTRVRHRLRECGVRGRSVQQVLARLFQQGCRQAVVQSLHVGPGGELPGSNRRTRSRSADWEREMEIAVGSPLLDGPGDIDRVARALADSLDAHATNVVVMHGSKHSAEHSRRNLALGRAIESNDPNVFAASLEGLPGMGPLAAAKRHAARTGHVHFVPAMLVSGWHVEADLAGHREGSWKQQLGAARTTFAEPLGRNRAILDIFFDHLDDAIRRLATLP